ncbi:nuclear pore complex protein Nup50 [Fopius arisanus]|uniref:Nuclear pore complex protein Nup50 n=1 Tax=Fopius arisanus TaxID=64838 RepID=A0A0C9RMT6_9HYME|nr:PREDICTED: nuclear pore complex protein Nup50 [Fopius arisanus]XP_011315340.1 PREDICTED: nuclear pore complex protein Nup50 [Fopius arisanus]XP_011315341.1 PREDICTED: nuclear pore complex protein Nup50 [Fopius arisanus]
MASKRTATSELNHENWNSEDVPEDAGKFAVASHEILEKRVVRTAKRRLGGGEGGATKNAFGSFAGFKTSPTATTAAFSFLKSKSAPAIPSSQPSTMFSLTSSSNGSAQTPENGLSMSSMPSMHLEKPSESQQKPLQEKKETIFKESSEYFAKLKGLNESVAQWIKTHVDANPFCILTPIFRDYDRYLKEIEAKREEQTVKTSEDAKTSKEPPKSGLFEMPTKNPSDSSDSVFTQKTAPTSGSIFGSGPSGKSIFEDAEGKNAFGGDANPFLNKKTESPNKLAEQKLEKTETKALSFPQTTTGTFSFGQSSTTGTSSASFTFGSGKPFSFGSSVVAPQVSEGKDGAEGNEDEDEPPKVEFKPVTEAGAIYEKRCKVFFKKDKVYSDRGVGILFLKPTPSGKTQLIVRAENSLGNLLLNTLLTESLRTQRMNKNTVMLVCLPLPDSQPPPVPVLFRVKTSEDADSLLEQLDSHKK